jgi:hypothetical protein
MHHMLVAARSLIIATRDKSLCLEDGGLIMRSRITQFTIRVVVAIGIAFVGVSAISSVVAYSAVERAWTMAQEALSKPFRSAPKAEFRLSEHQQLRRILLKP